ncbi:hypothetical protein DB42_BP00410 [Neochlamydia sp. EPS4]|uniref:hypothetical protein n=1 Tax=Neochlamydia sp. EPS4 TaxID=1478175 RepID=UPI0005831331|nr:hypothetical protein [Neochlamydia sp. EPS4]KIC73860.1 hypothetical protein DB42_BP00410 [Neochlamydia sp. EPS4]
MASILNVPREPYHLNFARKQIQSPIQRNYNPCQALKTALIKEIVKKSLLELAIALSFTGLACLFVATPLGMATLLLSTIASLAITTLLRLARAYCIFRVFQLKHSTSRKAVEKKTQFTSWVGFINALIPTAFRQLVDANTREVIVHEGGHALAAKILIKNPLVNVSITPFNGGQTTYYVRSLTTIGQYIGRANSELLIVAAGPALAVLAATAGYSASLALSKSHPELSRYLKTATLSTISQHFLYALSALWTTTSIQKHDFVNLMAAGLSPIVAAISIVALPILIRVGFYIYHRNKGSQKEKTNEKEKIALNNNGRFQGPLYNSLTLEAPPI